MITLTTLQCWIVFPLALIGAAVVVTTVLAFAVSIFFFGGKDKVEGIDP